MGLKTSLSFEGMNVILSRAGNRRKQTVTNPPQEICQYPDQYNFALLFNPDVYARTPIFSKQFLKKKKNTNSMVKKRNKNDWHKIVSCLRIKQLIGRAHALREVKNFNHRMKFIEHCSTDVLSSWGTSIKTLFYPLVSLDDVIKRCFGTSLSK